MAAALAGKVALVTGASRGIGAAIAERLARDGADVAITYASSGARAQEVTGAIAALGRRSLALRADSADAAAVQAAVARTIAELGRLDVLVNNAGVAMVAPLEAFSLDDFDRTVAVNVRAVFAATQAAARHMGNGGRIITIGSVNADRAPIPGASVYAMSKAAAATLSRGLARDLAPRGITVNTVQPGPTDTEMNPADGPMSDAMRSQVPLGRFGRSSEIADVVAFLAGPEAAFVTGATINVDGGYLA